MRTPQPEARLAIDPRRCRGPSRCSSATPPATSATASSAPGRAWARRRPGRHHQPALQRLGRAPSTLGRHSVRIAAPWRSARRSATSCGPGSSRPGPLERRSAAAPADSTSPPAGEARLVRLRPGRPGRHEPPEERHDRPPLPAPGLPAVAPRERRRPPPRGPDRRADRGDPARRARSSGSGSSRGNQRRRTPSSGGPSSSASSGPRPGPRPARAHDRGLPRRARPDLGRDRCARLEQARPRRWTTSTRSSGGLGDIRTTWQAADPEARAELARAIYRRITVVNGAVHSVALTEEAKRLGLVLAMPEYIAVVLARPAGLGRGNHNHCRIRIEGRADWLRASKRSA
jgi:hypothetical protein